MVGRAQHNASSFDEGRKEVALTRAPLKVKRQESLCRLAVLAKRCAASSRATRLLGQPRCHYTSGGSRRSKYLSGASISQAGKGSFW